jgi:hypothetical protein
MRNPQSARKKIKPTILPMRSIKPFSPARVLQLISNVFEPWHRVLDDLGLLQKALGASTIPDALGPSARRQNRAIIMG